MDGSNMILTGSVLPPSLLEQAGQGSLAKSGLNLDPEELKDLSDDRKVQVAKDFESLFIGRLLEEMKKTIGDWGFEKDGASKQIQGIFWLYLARDVADKGGLGLWKQIHQLMTEPEQADVAGESLDKGI